jgi:hypothetical protein
MCNCKKNKTQPPVITPEPIPVPTPPVEDWYNNIDTIEPIKTEGE